MKILILANNDVGLYKFRKELIQELLKENEVIISLPYGEFVEPLKEIGCRFINTPIDRRGINPITDIKLLLCYFRIAVALKPDLVITYTIKPNVYGGFISRLLHIPYAVNITGLGTTFQTENLIKKLVCFLYRISCRRAKIVFFENDENKQIFIDHHLIREEQAYKLNGAGVNLEEYPFTEYPDKNEPIRFLFIGRVMKEKGVDELFEAARKIKKEYPEVFFDVVGPMEDEYSSVIKELEKDGIITYYGYQKNVKPFIIRCSCFVLPSWHEGMANTNLECASSGRPVITSNISGCNEAIVEGISGLLCIPHNSASLCDALKKIISMSYDDRRSMGYKGRKYMEKTFDKKLVVDRTLNGLFNK